jgi:hypothetical protein
MSLRNLLPLAPTLALLAASCGGHSPEAPTARGTSLTVPTVTGCPSADSASASVTLLSAQSSYACRTWWPYTPAGGETLVDFITPADDDEGLGPSASSVTALERIGARVTHRFNVAMVRAIVDPLRAAPLVGNWRGVAAYQLRTVSDRCAFDAEVDVTLTRGVRQADLTLAQTIGAQQVTRYGSNFDTYSAVIDDARIPLLRSLPGVKLVRAISWGSGCGD